MKQKHWKVSVFDKTIETIKDDSFYATDTEVYLVFELIDEDFTPDSATVTVYNDYGKATIHESVEVADGIVRYKIPVEAIQHAGDWRTQVIFTKDNVDDTTGVIEFVVGGHLLGSKKPSIVAIENWSSFIKHAEGLVEDWEQLEKIRQVNERQRELAESARQNEFETNEVEREINESARQANEQGRETAESVRVANEAERISKDSERDSKIEAVEETVEVPVTNLTTNGDFRDGANGWIASGGTIEIQEDGLGFTTTNPTWNNLVRLSSQVNVPIGKYYWRVVANTPTGDVDLRIGNVSNKQIREHGVFDVYSNVVNVNSDTSSSNPIYLNTAGQPVNTQIIVKSVLTINLTATFGAGNEPTPEEMDELIELIGWFDGKITLTQKQQLIWTLNLIRKNRNAITALGGGIV